MGESIPRNRAVNYCVIVQPPTCLPPSGGRDVAQLEQELALIRGLLNTVPLRHHDEYRRRVQKTATQQENTAHFREREAGAGGEKRELELIGRFFLLTHQAILVGNVFEKFLVVALFQCQSNPCSDVLGQLLPQLFAALLA
jgi:hypothetical protein